MRKLPAQRFVTFVMDVLVAVAIVLTAGIVARYFGVLAQSAVGGAVLRLADALTPAFGLPRVSTPYFGVFDASAAATVAGVLVMEWVLAIVRRRL